MNRAGVFVSTRLLRHGTLDPRRRLGILTLTALIMLAGCADEEPAGVLEPRPVSPDRTTREGLVALFADAHAKRDLDAYAECLHPDFTFYMSDDGIPESWTVDRLDRDADLEVTRSVFDSLEVRLDFAQPAAEESVSWIGFRTETRKNSAADGVWSTFTVDVGFSRMASEETLDHWVTGEADLYLLPDPRDANLWTLWKITDRTRAWTEMKTAFGQPEASPADTTETSYDDPGGDAPADTTGGEEEPAGAIHQSYRSSLERASGPDASGLPDLVRGNHEFAADIYARLREGEGNLLFSPLSIRMAFAMVYAGARGETAVEMADVLRFETEGESLHNSMNALDLALADRNRPPDDWGSGVELFIANAFWGQIGWPFRADYLDLVAMHYGAGVEGLNFSRAPDACREIINGWVADRTRDRIRDLLPPRSITEYTLAVLTNTLYLKAAWMYAFFEDWTREEDFTTLDGEAVRVPMMNGEMLGAYTEGVGFRAAELLYQGEELGMVIILPDLGEFESFEAGFGVDPLEAILADLEHVEELWVALPQFSFDSAFELRRMLVAMGMVLPFEDCLPGAGCPDFSCMVGPCVPPIHIQEAYHKTFIAVDEKGSEAAAATAIVMGVTTGPHPIPIPFEVDRPFIFLIRDRVTGAVLFLGRVLDPTKG